MALRLGDDVPIEYQADYERWKGEPVRAIIIPKKLFRQNGKGYPVLLRHHQNIILSLAHLEPYIVIEVNSILKYLQIFKIGFPGNQTLILISRESVPVF